MAEKASRLQEAEERLDQAAWNEFDGVVRGHFRLPKAHSISRNSLTPFWQFFVVAGAIPCIFIFWQPGYNLLRFSCGVPL